MSGRVFLLTNGILVLICIDARVDHIAKQVVHDVSQALCCEHTMQGTNKHSLGWVEMLGRLLHTVAVTEDPRNHLNL